MHREISSSFSKLFFQNEDKNERGEADFYSAGFFRVNVCVAWP
jgi:hypothetical protein